MHSRLFCAFLTAACLCAQVRRAPPNHDANSPTSQTSSLKPGTIDGTTINSISNTPVQKAVVSLRNTSQNFSYIAASDASGHFQFPEVEPGTYQVVTASAQGFSYLAPPRDKFIASQITVAEDGHVTGITVQLRPFGVITGKVVDDDGEPLPGVNMQALRYDSSRGPKSLIPVGNASTDDRGEYRIFDLPPGRYYLRAFLRAPSIGPNMKSNIAETGYPLTFYPGGTDPSQASRPEVKPGAETFGIDFRLQKVPVYHIRGKVENSHGNNSAIQAQMCGGTPISFPNQIGSGLQADGSFDIGGVTAGTYCINYSYYENEKGVTAHEMVAISDRSINGLSLTAVPAGDLQGLVQIDGNVTLSTPGQQPLRVDIQPLNGIGRFQNTDVKDDGTFVLAGTPPADYLINVSGLPKGSYIKSFEYGEQDISDGVLPMSGAGGPIKIHLASDGGQLNATVLTEKGDPAANMLVTIVPQGRLGNRRDLKRITVSDQNGKLQQSGMAPGEYKVIAMDDNDTSLAQSEDFIAALGTKAASVTIHSGGNESVEVKVVSPEEVDQIKSKL
jgi:hypothetical protein